MRIVTLVLVILLTVGGVARAAGETRDAGMDSGAKLALAGGIVFAATYEWTAIGGAIDDGIGCGLGGHPSGCHHHGALAYPLVGGFMDGSPGGVISSIFQVGGVLVMTVGLATHKWRVPVDHWTKVRF